MAVTDAKLLHKMVASKLNTEINSITFFSLRPFEDLQGLRLNNLSHIYYQINFTVLCSFA